MAVLLKREDAPVRGLRIPESVDRNALSRCEGRKGAAQNSYHLERHSNKELRQIEQVTKFSMFSPVLLQESNKS